MMNRSKALALFLGSAVLAAGVPAGAGAQENGDLGGHVSALQREYPELHDLLIRMERAHGVMFGGLAEEGEVMRSRADTMPTFGFELDMVERLTQLVSEPGTAEEVAEEAEQGFAVVGDRGAEIIARGNAFYREVLGILAETGMTFPQRRAAAAEAVGRYQSRPEVALPSAPKNMDILYDHPYALDFRSAYTDLDGLIWAGHWLRLAATEPLTDFPDKAVRAEGIDTVTTRYFAKLSYGEPPEFFPSEIPLAPAIAPGLIFLSPESAMIWDNLSMMQEVLADILASPSVEDVDAALEDAIAFFMDPAEGITEQGVWEIMALRHGIFFQGGYPLRPMTESELNVGGHFAHTQGGGAIIIPGMPG
jgi:hypothetical protein